MVKILTKTLPEIWACRGSPRSSGSASVKCLIRPAGALGKGSGKSGAPSTRRPGRPTAAYGAGGQEKGVPFRRSPHGPSWGPREASGRGWLGQDPQTAPAGDLDAPEGLVGVLRFRTPQSLCWSVLDGPEGEMGQMWGLQGRGRAFGPEFRHRCQ